MASLEDLQRLLDKAAEVIPEQALQIIEVEGLNFIKKNFQEQGFNDNGVEKWKPRKTTDRQGRDLTRYRTSRHGAQGSLTRFGQKEQGRAILIGHNTGGDKLANSFKARREKLKVIFYTYKEYAERHNEGLDGMPKRQFISKSAYLEKRIEQKLKTVLDKKFRQ